jgi:hypothetical protein
MRSPSAARAACQYQPYRAGSPRNKRWRIERARQELEQEINLGHHEGQGWRGFLAAERAALLPQQNQAPRASRRLWFPEPIGQAEPPIRPERHVVNSITTMRLRIGHALHVPSSDAHAADALTKPIIYEMAEPTTASD